MPHRHGTQQLVSYTCLNKVLPIHLHSHCYFFHSIYCSGLFFPPHVHYHCSSFPTPPTSCSITTQVSVLPSQCAGLVLQGQPCTHHGPNRCHHSYGKSAPCAIQAYPLQGIGRTRKPERKGKRFMHFPWKKTMCLILP